MLSAASLERIRLALEIERPISLPNGEDLTVRDGAFSDQGISVELFGGLDLVGRVDRFGGAPATIGPPTHQDMMAIMTPRWFTEGRPSGDLLSVATGSAFSLLPIAIKALGGWLFGDDEENRPEHPILTEDEESLALAHVRADSRVLDAVLRQRGRTVVLSLVVPPDTSPDIARELGERFAVLVKAFSSTEPEPDDEIGAGDFDYLVRVSSPAETAIAFGGKVAAGATFNW